MYTVPVEHSGLAPLFDQPYLHHVLRGMQAGNSPALAWVDDREAPKSAFIWDKMHCLYFGGDADNAAFNAALHEHLTQMLLEQQKLKVFKICRTSAQWDDPLAAFFQPVQLHEYQRVLYSARPDLNGMQPPILPDTFRVARIDETLLRDSQGAGAEALTAEIKQCWESVERFLANGFGFCVVNEASEVVCWCTAEYVSAGMCGVGIETLEAYQGQGLATAAAQAWMRHAAEIRYQVYWDSWLANAPSVRVAEKVGFHKAAEYSVLFLLRDYAEMQR